MHKKTEPVLRIAVGELDYAFSGEGFISGILLNLDSDSKIELVKQNFGTVCITLDDGRKLFPYTRPEAAPRRGRFEEAELVIFDEILWKDQQGNPVPEFRLSLRYELWNGGRGFVTAFFCASDIDVPGFSEFAVKFDLALSAFQEINWACLPRPRKIDGSLIQALGAGRYLTREKNFHVEGETVPAINFNARCPGAPSAYFEIVMEGQNSLNETPDDNYTDLQWAPSGDFSAEWGFVKDQPCKNEFLRLFQWRNQWGWVLKSADKVRKNPPFHMYHYFDGVQRYPSNMAIMEMAEAGTDVLALHECWRFDVQNGGIPFSADELRRVIEEAHKYDIRVLLYIRGDEASAVESACQWFDLFLKKDYDGLYMDYGGPLHLTAADESYPGGRISFRNYFLRMKSLRNRVGEKGLFLAHTGPSFSAIGFTGGIIDGYVSGEGESGVMVDGRREYEYYSMASASPGTMWTGAFPAYSSSRMRPFLASAGQYPHNPLGVQFPTCSLAHPRNPGLNDTAFKPLWKLWRFFRNERNIRVFNDYNSSGVFPYSENAGHYLMISKDSRRALLIVSNFSDAPAEIKCSVDWQKAGFNAASSAAWMLLPTESEPGRAFYVAPASEYLFRLGGYDVGAIYLSMDPSSGLAEDFEKGYPPISEENKAYLDYVNEQKVMRYEPLKTKELFMRVVVPPTWLPYEFSLVYDLYYNTMELVEFEADGFVRRIGWLTKGGIVQEEPVPGDYIWPSQKTEWIPLHGYFSPGEHFIGIRSMHYGKPFYSFLYAELSKDKNDDAACRIEFVNDLEPDRQYLRWKICLL